MGYGFGGYGPAGGYDQHCQEYGRSGNTFALIVVLFILLIIVGTAFYR